MATETMDFTGMKVGPPQYHAVTPTMDQDPSLNQKLSMSEISFSRGKEIGSSLTPSTATLSWSYFLGATAQHNPRIITK